MNDNSDEGYNEEESELWRVLATGTPSSIEDCDKDTVLDLPQSSQDFNFKPAPILTSLRKFRPLQSMKFEKSGYEILSRYRNQRSWSKSKSQVWNNFKTNSTRK